MSKVSSRNALTVAALAGAVLLAMPSVRAGGQAEPVTQQLPQVPEPPTIDYDGKPMTKNEIAERRAVATCLLNLNRMIPAHELEDYARIVVYYSPHKITATETIWMGRRLMRAVIETAQARDTANVESMVLRPTRVSRALEICLSPQAAI